MTPVFDPLLAEIQDILAAGLDIRGTQVIWGLLGGQPLPEAWLGGMKLAAETLPKALERPFTQEERLLHFLWEALDRLPASLMVPLSLPLRRLLAARIFKKCGKAFLAEEGVRFNFGQDLEVGDNVYLRRGAILDTQGGLTIGHSVSIGEDVRIFTHAHSEASHIERFYKPVVIEDFAKISTGAIILPGVSIGREAIVSSGAVVGQNVPMNAVAAGSPAVVVRQRQTDGRHGESLDHIWLF